jgi:hypothetical protein
MLSPAQAMAGCSTVHRHAKPLAAAAAAAALFAAAA